MKGLALLVAVLASAHLASALYTKGGPVSLLSPASFDKVLNSKVPVFVEFFAPWQVPCHARLRPAPPPWARGSNAITCLPTPLAPYLHCRCGHCKSLAPAYAKAAEKMAGIVPFVAVDCDAEKNKQLCGKYGIQGFPTLKIFVNGKPTDYQGERSAKAMVTAVTALLSSKGVKELKSAADAEAFTKPSAATKVLLLTDKGTISPLYKSLSARYAGKLTFGQAHKSVGDLAATHATSFPTLLVFTPEGEAIKYEGELKPQKLIDFLKDFAGAGKKADAKAPKEEEKKDKPKKQEEEKPKKQAEEKPKKKAEESEKEPVKPPVISVVKNLTLAGVKAQLKEEGGIHLLAFYNSADACAERLAKLNAAVLGTTGVVRAGQVPVAAGQASVVGDIYPVDAAALGGDACSVQAFMLPFEDRDDTDEWKPYTGEEGGSGLPCLPHLSAAATTSGQACTSGEARCCCPLKRTCISRAAGELESKDLAKWAMELFPDKHVTAVDEETHQQWAMTDVSRPKVLLFTDKAEPPALYRALSTNLQKLNMDFGMASGASEEFKKRFNAVRVRGCSCRGGPGGSPALVRDGMMHEVASRPARAGFPGRSVLTRLRRIAWLQTPYIVATVGQPSPDEKGPNGEPRMLLSMQPYSGRMNYKDISQFLMMVSMRMG